MSALYGCSIHERPRESCKACLAINQEYADFVNGLFYEPKKVGMHREHEASMNNVSVKNAIRTAATNNAGAAGQATVPTQDQAAQKEMLDSVPKKAPAPLASVANGGANPQDRQSRAISVDLDACSLDELQKYRQEIEQEIARRLNLGRNAAAAASPSKVDDDSLQMAQGRNDSSVAAASAVGPSPKDDKSREYIQAEDVQDTDVLPGRGGLTNHHFGNIMFRQVVDSFRDEYQAIPEGKRKRKAEKSEQAFKAVIAKNLRLLDKEDKEDDEEEVHGYFVMDSTKVKETVKRRLRNKK